MANASWRFSSPSACYAPSSGPGLGFRRRSGTRPGCLWSDPAQPTIGLPGLPGPCGGGRPGCARVGTPGGPPPPGVQRIRARRDRGRVRFAGEVPPGEMPAYYRSADVVILPSINDAFGLVILEAMASGLPVIATDHSAASDAIEDKIHGFVGPTRDAGALKDRILS